VSARSAPTTLYRVAHSLLQNYSLRYPLPALLRTRLIDLWAGMAMLNTYCVRCGEHIAWWPSGRERRWDYSLELAFDMPKLGVKVLHHAPTAHELDEFQKNPGQSLPLQGLSIFNLKGHLAGVPMQYALNKTGYSPGTGFPSRVYHGWLRREGTAQNKYVLDAEKRDLAAEAYLRVAQNFLPNELFQKATEPIRAHKCVGIHLRRGDKVHDAHTDPGTIPSWETTVNDVWQTNNRTLAMVAAMTRR